MKFTHPEPGPLATRFGAFHSGEIPYVSGTMDAGTRSFTQEDHAISRLMQSYWINFIRTGNPNGVGLLKWPSLDSGDFMQLGKVQQVTPLLSAEQREAFRFWLGRPAARSVYFEVGANPFINVTGPIESG